MKLPRPFCSITASAPLFLAAAFLAFAPVIDGSIALCRTSIDIIVDQTPWFERYHGIAPMIVLAGALWLLYAFHRRRNAPAARKNRIWYALVFVAGVLGFLR